jgi:hypothetical protein
LWIIQVQEPGIFEKLGNLGLDFGEDFAAVNSLVTPATQAKQKAADVKS